LGWSWPPAGAAVRARRAPAERAGGTAAGSRGGAAPTGPGGATDGAAEDGADSGAEHGAAGGAGGAGTTPDGSAGASAGAGVDAADDGAIDDCETICGLPVAQLEACTQAGTTPCVHQHSDTKASDGTDVVVDNTCYADGSKALWTSTTLSQDGGVQTTSETATYVQVGVTCLKTQTQTQHTATGADSYVEVIAETFRDGANNLIGTLTDMVTVDADGGYTDSQTVTCPGAAPRPTIGCSSSGAAPSCASGTCM
jgi:hypothetical protein